MDGEGEKGTQTANVHRSMLPSASQRGVPFDRETRLRAAIRSRYCLLACLLACLLDPVNLTA